MPQKYFFFYPLAKWNKKRGGKSCVITFFFTLKIYLPSLNCLYMGAFQRFLRKIITYQLLKPFYLSTATAILGLLKKCHFPTFVDLLSILQGDSPLQLGKLIPVKQQSKQKAYCVAKCGYLSESIPQNVRIKI